MAFIPLDDLKNGALELGIELSDKQLEQFDRYARFLVETNEKFNLTRITSPRDIVVSHYLDSLTCIAAHTPSEYANIIDVGAGAGFPGIPIKIVRPDLNLTLLDSTSKKVTFMTDTAALLELGNTIAIHARAEDLGRDKNHREKYDIAYARALSELAVLAELCLPLVKIGGYVVAQKSEDIDEELTHARPLIGQLGGQIDNIVKIKLPLSDVTRRIVVLAKVKPTPESFPRAFGKISRSRRL